MHIFITGATGLIGKAVSRRLCADGHTVTALVRGNAKPGEVHWMPGKPLDSAVFANADAVIHLAGKNVATRWTDDAKRELFYSRVEGTRTISDAIAAAFQRTG